MFRKMRRENQALNDRLCGEILKRGSYGVLALNGDGGYPYALPLNYVCLDGKIYFHCALEGHKLDAIRRDGRASFCVVDKSDVDAPGYTTRFASVIAFGQARVLDDGEEKRRCLVALGDKYCPGQEEKTRQVAEGSLERTCVVELTIAHLSGKESKDLAHARRAGTEKE